MVLSVTQINIENSMVMFVFLFLNRSILFVPDLFQKIKIVLEAEMWIVDYFEHVEFDSNLSKLVKSLFSVSIAIH